MQLTQNQVLAMIWAASPDDSLPSALIGPKGSAALTALESKGLIKSDPLGDLKLTPAGVRLVLRWGRR